MTPELFMILASIFFVSETLWNIFTFIEGVSGREPAADVRSSGQAAGEPYNG